MQQHVGQGNAQLSHKTMRYKADLTAGSLKIQESRIIADLLLQGVTPQQWRDMLIQQNILQVRHLATAIRLARLIRQRLELVDSGLWILVRDGTSTIASQALLAAAIKQSALLGDFLDLVVREQYQLFAPTLSQALWNHYLEDCRGRDPEMPQWNESTKRRLRSSVFQTLAQSGFLENTRTLRLQPVHIASQVLRYLHDRHEAYVLRCIQVSS